MLVLLYFLFIHYMVIKPNETKKFVSEEFPNANNKCVYIFKNLLSTFIEFNIESFTIFITKFLFGICNDVK